jgi:hypothetical protein
MGWVTGGWPGRWYGLVGAGIITHSKVNIEVTPIRSVTSRYYRVLLVSSSSDWVLRISGTSSSGGGQDSPLVSVLAFDLLPGGQALPPSLAPSLHRSSESRGGHDSPLATFSSSSSAEYTGASDSPRAPAKGSRHGWCEGA